MPVHNNKMIGLPVYRCAAVLFGGLLMMWPAFYNGYPIIYPDSMTYLDDGRPVARALFLHRLSDYYGMRSLIYSLGILPWHWNRTAWPIVVLNALLSAYVLWLVIRSILPGQAVKAYLIIVLLLSALTSLSWYVSLIMPDCLGPLLYLSFYLLVFARESLSRAERISLYPLAWWAVASHATHLPLSAALCVILALVLAWQRQPVRRSVRLVGEIAGVVVLAAAAQMALNAYLYGEPSLNGDRPPFLMARLIADGPGRWYLEKHCGEVKFAICQYVQKLPNDPDNFLWAPDGIVQTANDETGRQLQAEEVRFALATLRAYPRELFAKSAAAFWHQLLTFGYEDLDASTWVLDVFDKTLPGQRWRYERSRQVRGDWPLDFFTTIQDWVVGLAAIAIAVFIPLVWSYRSSRLTGLGVTILSMVIVNAGLTGPISMVEERFESRVIWLVPLLALLLIFYWLDRGRCIEAARTAAAHDA